MHDTAFAGLSLPLSRIHRSRFHGFVDPVIMEAMRDNWSDARLDDLSHRLDDGFNRVDADLRALNARFDALQRTMLQVGGGIIIALVGLIATRL
jgi:hypothetical protein